MDPVVGWIGCTIAAVGFATNFLIIKAPRYDPKDGMFFQLNMVIGIWISGLIFHIAVRGSPPFQPFGMLGGFLWATGNAACPFIISQIGIGLGLLLWGTLNMTIGWASAHFGILLVEKQTVSDPTLNVIGFALAVCSILFYSQVKGMDDDEKAERAARKAVGGRGALGSINTRETDRLLDVAGRAEKGGFSSSSDAEAAAADKTTTRALAVLMACAAGLLFGCCFNPPQHVSDTSRTKFCSKINGTGNDREFCGSVNRYCQSNLSHVMDCADLASYGGRMYCVYDDHKDKCGGIPLEDMVFSQFTGMLLTAFFWFNVYAVYTQGFLNQEPYVNKILIGPGFICGAIWAVAQISWFYANANLPLAVSFPIITTAPGLLGTAIGIVFYNEVSLKARNLIVLGVAIALACVSDALIAKSL